MTTICAMCPDCMDHRDVQPGDFCRVHWSTVEKAVPDVGFVCDHKEH